jgi:hypothetical protein
VQIKRGRIDALDLLVSTFSCDGGAWFHATTEAVVHRANMLPNLPPLFSYVSFMSNTVSWLQQPL